MKDPKADFIRFCRFMAENRECTHLDTVQAEKITFKYEYKCSLCADIDRWYCLSCDKVFCNNHISKHCLQENHFILMDTHNFEIKYVMFKGVFK